MIEGRDLDPAAVWLANVVLAAETLPLLAATPASRRRPIPVLATVGDGLAQSDRLAATVLMNPPYGRVRLDNSERRRFADYLYGHANLYGMFLAAGLETLDEWGVLAALIPTSVTAGRYSSALRAALSERAPLREMTFVAERGGVFSGVLQETCLATFTRAKARKTAISSIDGQVSHVAEIVSPRGDRPWLLPRRADHAHVAAAAASMPLTLASAGWRVSTGPLVWNRRRADLYDRPRCDRYPIVWAANIDGGELHRDVARDVTRYLATQSDRDRATMVLDEPAILVQRTTAPEQTRRVVAVDLSCDELAAWGGRVVVENHVNVIRASRPDPLLARATLVRLLTTPTIDRVVRCLAGSVAVSAYELESIPLRGAEVLATWAGLDDSEFALAVAAAYQPEAECGAF